MSAGEMFHCFVGKGYAKVMQLQAGHMAVTHSHRFDHDSHLVIGEVALTTNGVVTKHAAPAVIRIAANVEHGILALSDVLWVCAHEVPEDLQDHDLIDEVLIA